jgi:NAD+ diphosphatase
MTQTSIIIRRSGTLLLTSTPALPDAADAKALPVATGERYAFDVDGMHYEAYNAAADADAPAQHSWVELKASYNLLSPTDYAAAGKAFELLYWDENHRFCGHCAQPLQRASAISKRCPQCGMEIFPQVSPAIIVLIRRGREALLVHARNFRRPIFGLVAGFVETGESVEQCVRREVKEETNLEVTNLRYVGSQPWSFPNSLMLAFTADYLSGTLEFRDHELTEGGFFDPDHLPPLPDAPSIARQLIDEWRATLL